jgi:hypothetical protein
MITSNRAIGPNLVAACSHTLLQALQQLADAIAARAAQLDLLTVLEQEEILAVGVRPQASRAV